MYAVSNLNIYCVLVNFQTEIVNLRVQDIIILEVIKEVQILIYKDGLMQ